MEEGGWRGPGSIESRTSDRECSAIRHAAFARVHSIFPKAYYPTLIRPWCTNELKTNVLSSSEPPPRSPPGPGGAPFLERRWRRSYFVYSLFLLLGLSFISSLSTGQWSEADRWRGRVERGEEVGEITSIRPGLPTYCLVLCAFACAVLHPVSRSICAFGNSAWNALWSLPGQFPRSPEFLFPRHSLSHLYPRVSSSVGPLQRT